MVKGSSLRLKGEIKNKWNVYENLTQTKGESLGEVIFIFKFPKSELRIRHNDLLIKDLFILELLQDSNKNFNFLESIHIN